MARDVPPNDRSSPSASVCELQPPWIVTMTIRDVILRCGFFAHGGNPEAAVDSWEATGMEAHEVDEWLAARYFAPDAAHSTSPMPA